MIYDRFGRPLTSLRISVTQRCNLKCIYCHQEGVEEQSNKEMTPEEIVKVLKICARYGVKGVKITGGEPLLRDDILEIVKGIRGIKGLKDISMTTNGVLLEKYAEGLKRAGLDRVNVSIDSLKPEIYASITGGENGRAVAGIKEAVEVGLNPVKLNMVVLKGINDKEIRSMIEFSSKVGAILQLIGLMETGDKEFFDKHFYDLAPMEKELENEATDIYVRKFMHGRTKYILDRNTEVEVVCPMHNTEFCGSCTRIRITADGRFKPCLMRRDNLVDFLTPMRNEQEGELSVAFMRAIKNREPYFKSKDTLKNMSTDVEIR